MKFMNKLKSETSILHEFLKIIITIVIINMIRYGSIFLANNASNYARVIIWVGIIKDYSLYGKYTFLAILAEKIIPSICYILAGLLGIWTLLRVCLSNNKIITKIAIIISNLLLMFSIIILTTLTYRITWLLGGVAIENCWCGTDYIRIEYK